MIYFEIILLPVLIAEDDVVSVLLEVQRDDALFGTKLT
jgi:hypothetical protein